MHIHIHMHIHLHIHIHIIIDIHIYKKNENLCILRPLRGVLSQPISFPISFKKLKSWDGKKGVLHKHPGWCLQLLNLSKDKVREFI